MGRDPTAVGLVADHAGGPRPRLRGRGVRARARRLGALHGARRRSPATRGLPVADLGHRAVRACPARGGDPGRRSPAPGCGLVAPRRRGHGPWRLGDPPAGLAPGGWSFEFDNDLYPDVDDTAVVALALRELGLGDEAVAARARLDWSGCSPGAAAGARSMSTTRRSGSTSSRSATSARSPTSRVPTSPPTLSRRSRTRPDTEPPR